MLTFKDIQDEVKRRSTRNQGGTQFDTAIKNAVNSSLFRISRECPWRVLRRTSTFDTLTTYTTGTTAAVISNSNLVTITGATLLTDGIQLDRRIKFDGSSTYYYINTVNSETSLTLDQNYIGTTTTATNYQILPQAQYNLPIQSGHRMFMWHEAWGFPYKMRYITEQNFFETAYYMTIKNVPTHYRMWGEDMCITQLLTTSNLSIVSSNASDTSIPITIFGTVNGYPDSEVVNTSAVSGTTTVTTANIYSKVERIVKGQSSLGRITVTGNSSTNTIAVIPSGDATAGILYKKVSLYPLPNTSFKMHVCYYKDPFRLVNDGDVHELGQEFDEAIILLAVSKLDSEQSKGTDTSVFYQLYQDELRTLRRTNIDKIDWFPDLKKPWQSNSSLLVSPNLLYGQVGNSGQFGPSSRR